MNARRWMRLRGLLRKESLQILRDPSSIAIAFVMPVVLLLLIGYGLSLDAKNVPLALVIENPNAESASFAAGFFQSPYFIPVRFGAVQDAEAAMRAREVDGIIWLRSNFTRQMLGAGAAPIGVIVNGVDANNARIVEGYLQQVWAGWLASYAAAHGIAFAEPLNVEFRVWFNPAVESADFLAPGLIALIMTLTGALLTAMVVAREWERGTMEALLVTPAAISEIIVSKLLPYFGLGMGGMALSVAVTTGLFHVPLRGSIWLLMAASAVFMLSALGMGLSVAVTTGLFHVPLRGSIWLLMAASAVFMLSALGMGLVISTFSKNQFAAGQIAITVAYMPAFMLSGFVFDIASMPAPIRVITYVVGARYFVAILQSLFLAGNVWPVVLPNMAALALMAAIFIAVARRLARKSLE
jgi:ABC-2 type transport system permease protein